MDCSFQYSADLSGESCRDAIRQSWCDAFTNPFIQHYIHAIHQTVFFFVLNTFNGVTHKLNMLNTIKIILNRITFCSVLWFFFFKDLSETFWQPNEHQQILQMRIYLKGHLVRLNLLLDINLSSKCGENVKS